MSRLESIDNVNAPSPAEKLPEVAPDPAPA